MTVAELLCNGRAAIVKHGWQQGRAPLRPGFCMFDALWSVGWPVGQEASQPLSVANKLLSAAADCGKRCVIDWHDAPGRTVEEVLAVYDKAIAAAMEAA